MLEEPDTNHHSDGIKFKATRQKSAKWHDIVGYVPLSGDDAKIVTVWKKKLAR